MNKTIELFLNGNKVELPDDFSLEFNYEITDYQNPTVIRNSFSKTVTIDGTPRNNNIFNNIWCLERIMDDGFILFNPSQRVDFELYNNSNLVESGYAKLESINRKGNGNAISYDINLFGGLGSFFFSLSYDVDSDKEKTLADLNFIGGSNPLDEFNFEINKNTVWNAWDALRTFGHNNGSYKKFDYIQFIPCYNGLPEDFDSDRVLINTHGLNGTKVRYTDNNGIVNGNFPMHISDDGNTYGSINGYLTADMMRECDEWEMMDLRSYLQRPALSVTGLFRAICDPQNNGGYNVVLDSDFFSSGNPYYSKAFITLPMLAPETDATDQYIEWNWYNADQYSYTGDGPKEIKWKIESIDAIAASPDVFQMEVEIHATITGATANKLYTSALVNNGYDPEYEPDPELGEPANPPELEYYGCTAFQMYGYGNGSLWYSSSAKCGSNTIVLTSKRDGHYIGRQSINNWWGDRPYPQSDIQYNFGYWKKVSGSDYVWHNETDDTDTVKLVMETNLMSEIPNISIAFSNIMIMNGMLVSQKGGYAFTSQYYEYQSNMNDGSYQYWRTVDFNNLVSNIVYKVNGRMRSYQPVTKKDLLGGLEGTPCDWLLSYCKLFGLFIEKDKFENTIYIKMRNNWYQNIQVDIEDRIDRSKEINITPLTFESKWYNFKYGEANGKFLDRYKNDYGQDFGKQLIDTRYNFDAEEIDLLEDTKFRNGMTALEKSNYFNKKVDVDGHRIPQCLYDWCTVTYYKDGETLETNMALPPTTSMEMFNPLTPKEYYDFLPKLHFYNSEKSPEEGAGVLCFYNGLKSNENTDYWLSDDIDEMFEDSESPCWLATVHEWNAAWTQRIAIKINTLPEFNRYVVWNNLITASWDFGYTKELFVPYYRYDVNRTPTMYQNYWQSYIQDLYSVNTRKVDAYVNLDTNNVYDFMKRFYWWENSIWVCTKIDNYDITKDRSTLCSFTKVNNIQNYLEMPTFNDKFFNFSLINSGNVPAQGTDEERSFYFNLDCSSDWVVVDDGSGFASFDPEYPTQGSFGVGYTIKATYLPNTSPAPRYALYSAYNSEGEARMIRVWQEGYVKEKYLNLNPTLVILPKEVITPVSVVVDSSANWYCQSGNWAVIDTVYGDSGSTTINVSATTNNTGSQRVLQVLFNNADGVQNTLNVKQKATEAVSLEQNEIIGAVYEVPASGGNVHYRLISDVECQVLPMGNTANYAVASGLVQYNTTIQPTNGTNFWIHFDPNTGTVTRNASFYAYYVDGQGGRHSIFPTVVQLPLTQLASGNTEVTYQSKSYTSATTLGASMQWNATTNNSWITILTPSGTSANTSVQYTIAQNNGGYRTGYIYITYKDEMGYNCNETIVIHQEGEGGGVIVNPTAITTTERGGSYLVGVTASSVYNVSSNTDWCDGEKLRDGNIVVSVGENNTYNRNAVITVTCGGDSATINVSQGSRYPSGYTLDYAPETIEFESSGGTLGVEIRSDSNWEITDNNQN